jgi:hypothetical protein
MKSETVIQVTENRRIVSYAYGWRLEILRIPEKSSKNNPNMEPSWVEDRPAYPATLSHGLSMLLERLFAEEGNMDLSEVPKRIEEALTALQQCDGIAREMGKPQVEFKK